MKNYKTTILGVLAIIGALVTAATAFINKTPIDFPSLLTALSAGVGLIMAKDAGVVGPGM